MCEFCEKIYNKYNYNTLEPYIYHGAFYTDGNGYGYHIVFPTDDGKDYTLHNILFCPYCRKKLGEAQEMNKSDLEKEIEELKKRNKELNAWCQKYKIRADEYRVCILPRATEKAKRAIDEKEFLSICIETKGENKEKNEKIKDLCDANMKLEVERNELRQQVDELKKRTYELESELSDKENLPKIENRLCGGVMPKEVTVDGFKCEIIQTAQGLYIDRDRIYEIIDRETEPLKKKLERKQTVIDQIDDILNELFGVTHNIVKTPEEFRKILKEKADNYNNVSDVIPEEPIKVAEMLINAEGEYERNSIGKAFFGTDRGKYNLFDVSELRQIAEHLLVYCNHNSEEAEQ